MPTERQLDILIESDVEFNNINKFKIMKPIQIIEGNELIAKFLGWESDKPLVYKVPNIFPSKGDGGWTEFSVQQIGFERDWNMLMAVVDKIKHSKLSYGSVLATINQWEVVEESLATINIEKVWLAVIGFIKWYNET